jgi:hypothetical protein
MSRNLKFIAAGALALAGALVTGVAQARDNVQWSIGINVPIDPYGAVLGTTIGNARPVYVQPAPVYYAPAPVYYAPAPVYYAPAPVFYRAQPVYYRPHHYGAYLPPVYMQPPRHGGWGRHGEHDGHAR